MERTTVFILEINICNAIDQIKLVCYLVIHTMKITRNRIEAIMSASKHIFRRLEPCERWGKVDEKMFLPNEQVGDGKSYMHSLFHNFIS